MLPTHSGLLYSLAVSSLPCWVSSSPWPLHLSQACEGRMTPRDCWIVVVQRHLAVTPGSQQCHGRLASAYCTTLPLCYRWILLLDHDTVRSAPRLSLLSLPGTTLQVATTNGLQWRFGWQGGRVLGRVKSIRLRVRGPSSESWLSILLRDLGIIPGHFRALKVLASQVPSSPEILGFCGSLGWEERGSRLVAWP